MGLKFKEFCTFKEGYVNPSQKEPKYFGGPIKWLRATDLNNSYVYTTTRTLTEEGFNSAGRSALLFKPNTISISKSGTVGRLGILKDYMCGNRAVINIDVNSEMMNMEYIFYWLLNNQNYIKDLAVGSVQRNLYVSVLENLEIDKKPILEQKVIANILSTLEEKIVTNNQINEKLEEMAQALFKRWFVDFEFPNENGEPYKSSGGEMVVSELGMVPQGWDVVNLDSLTSKFTTGLNPRKNFVLGNGENYYVTIKNMSNNQIFLDDRCDFIDDEAVKIINKRSDLQKGDILFSGIGTIGRVYLIDETPNNWNISESIFTLRPSEVITSDLLYLILLSDGLQGYAQQLASGSVQKGVRMRDLKNYKLPLPDSKLINQFSEMIKPLIYKQKQLMKENKSLGSIKDYILPKLMSGEIRVQIEDSNVEKQVNN